MGLHHPLLADFPEYREIILKLHSECDQFRKMYEEYHRIDDHVFRFEEGLERAGWEVVEQLKMKRVLLKDALYHKCWAAIHRPPQVAVAA